MPEPFLAMALAGYAALQPLRRSGSAVSLEAKAAKEYASVVYDHVESSWALFGKKEAIITKIREFGIECAEADWDGYDAEPVSQNALERAEVFIRSLPESISMPEVSVEPDGDLSFDWNPTSTKTFSVSVGSSDRFAYAWFDGTDRGHAVARSSNGEVPARILEEIQRIT
ncbi:MAG: hypothetical protein O3C43_13150 [Verrucomicrobia bacterium]|nr:hypothetical protein [Verrucomicrobiota bacterium]